MPALRRRHSSAAADLGQEHLVLERRKRRPVLERAANENILALGRRRERGG